MATYYVGTRTSTTWNNLYVKPYVPTEKERLSAAARSWAYQEDKDLAKQA